MNGIVVLIFTLFLALNIVTGIRSEETTAQFGRFGKITLYPPSAHPANVVLFVSGDGGWNLGVIDMARDLAALDALVVGVDITYYLKQLERSSEPCVYPAADFELLSKYVQKKRDFPQYITPVLIGYSSGATLVYATLAQAPGNTFMGAISLGFCPDLALSKPLCRGSGLQWTQGPNGKGARFLPAKHLEVPWIAFQGTIDQVCNAEPRLMLNR
jgi:type IV secretory pathway VirJ component